MKKLLFVFLLLPFIVLGQQRKQLTPTGFQQRVSPFSVLTGAVTDQPLYGDTIMAGTIGAKYSKIRFTVSCYLTTGAINLSNLTLKFTNGSNSVTILNSLGLSLGITTKPIVITGTITNQGNGNGYVKLLVEQDGNTINGLSNWYGVRQIWPMDFNQDQSIFLRVTTGGLGVGATVVGVDEIERQGF